MTPFDPHELIGRWSAAVGTFCVMMDETWWFAADGTGRVVLESGSGAQEREFEWSPLEVGVVQLRLVSVRDLGRPDPEPRDEDGPEPWERWSVALAHRPNEAGGTTPVILSPPREGFAWGLFPLARS